MSVKAFQRDYNCRLKLTQSCGICATTVYLAELSPAVRTCPMITSETSSGLTEARFRTSLITTEHKSFRGTVDRAPFKQPASKKKMTIIALL